MGQKLRNGLAGFSGLGFHQAATKKLAELHSHLISETDEEKWL